MKRPQHAAILVRISDDRAGDSAGVGRQESDARALAERLGWNVAEVITENDTSAFKRRMVQLPDGTTALRVFRPEFRRLINGLASGQFDGLIAYHLDRVARDPRDLEDLIDVVEAKRIKVESVTGSIRLASDADITMARIGVAIANQSSRDASRRIRRKHEELAERGRFAGGVRRFGFMPDGVTHNAEEASAIRWAAGQILEGRSVSALTKEFNRDGLKPVRAERWSSKALGDILRSPRIAGLRIHRGEVVGLAAWDPIVDRETWDAVTATLHARGRGKTQPTLRRWCNSILFCGRCGVPLCGNKTAKAWRYWCDPARGGCAGIAIQGPDVEAEVERRVLEYLQDPQVVQRLAGATASEASTRARHSLQEDEEQLKSLSRLWAENHITLPEYSEARRVIEQRINDTRRALLTVVPDRVRTVFTSDDVAASWAALSPHGKRELVQTLVKGWSVAPADLSGPRRFDASRLTVIPL